ncbi:MAG: Na+/H+ antiporter subunit E [Planctomycetes bacterium]|nr:Na+/H+ antiporter subunit E [Planctomycetota bacterium]
MAQNASDDRTGRARYSLALGVVLLGIWLLWSGHYTPLVIGFGVVSCAIVLILTRRMNIADEECAPLLGLRPFVYLPWLIKEITLANIDIAKRVLTPEMPINPQMIRVRASQKGDLGRVIYANSITLTPGTVSVDMQDGEIVVHALTSEAADEDKSGDMDRRVTALEGLS